MNNELINVLSKLKLQESAYKRNLDRNYYNKKLRKDFFEKLKEVQREIEKVNFKIRLERGKKNANNNTCEP